MPVKLESTKASLMGLRRGTASVYLVGALALKNCNQAVLPTDRLGGLVIGARWPHMALGYFLAGLAACGLSNDAAVQRTWQKRVRVETVSGVAACRGSLPA